jgi:hypothetical protein
MRQSEQIIWHVLDKKFYEFGLGKTKLYSAVVDFLPTFDLFEKFFFRKNYNSNLIFKNILRIS